MFGNHDKKGYVFLIGILLVMIASSLWGSSWLYAKSQEKVATLEQIQEVLEEQIAIKEQLELQVQELEVQNKQLITQIEELSKEIQALQEKGIEPVYEEADKKYAYLTFDDGPSQNTVKILDFLQANHIKATFFVLGKQGQGDIYRRIVEEGHTIAVHSNTHDYSKIYKSVDAFMQDVNALATLIEEETGVIPDVFRFPGGSNNKVSHRYGGADIMDKIIPVVEEAGYTYFDWNVDSLDAAKGLQDKQTIVQAVLSQSKYTDNAVILLHDAAAKTTTVDALPEIVQGLKEQGFTFVPLTKDSKPVKFR
jgi:peptidoglycan/xylan/chitin deacetylase (PgdA/CDA1 family)